jgi:hypothetical protein
MKTTAYKIIDGNFVGVELSSVSISPVLNDFLKETRETVRELEIEVGYDLFKKFM